MSHVFIADCVNAITAVYSTDPDSIARGEEYYTQDVPGDGSRYVRDALGIDTVIVGGSVAYTNGGYTDAANGEIIPGVL